MCEFNSPVRIYPSKTSSLRTGTTRTNLNLSHTPARLEGENYLCCPLQVINSLFKWVKGRRTL